nr:MAG TPA: hypothetical protein [Caudoviricetes sp.]
MEVLQCDITKGRYPQICQVNKSIKSIFSVLVPECG